MLSIIQLVAPSWAALPGGEPAHWSSAMGRETSGGREAEKIQNNGESEEKTIRRK